MELEKQVCSLELAKKLKELGVKQESYFVWRSDGGKLWHPTDYDYEMQMGCYAAFTVAELGEVLPKHILRPDDGGANRYISITHGKAPFNDNRTWYVYYDEVNEPCDYEVGQEEKTEADARAKMLVCLLENKLIS